MRARQEQRGIFLLGEEPALGTKVCLEFPNSPKPWGLPKVGGGEF